MNEFLTIESDKEAEIIEKKSRFIANICKVESKEYAEKKIKEIKKKNYNAKHYCFAFIIIDRENEIIRQSDDGEPSGTAGMPLLNILQKNNLKNILIVVTRYFGGILLGTGGLTRAYNEAGLQALNKTKIIQQEEGTEAKVVVEYKNSEDFNYYCKINGIKIIEIKYDADITYKIELNKEKGEKIKNEIINLKIKEYIEICRKNIEKY